MSLFNDSFRKLKQLFEDDAAAQAAAAAPVASTSNPGAAAMRAEARAKRKLDVRERLAAMIAEDGSVTGGLVKYINLYPIAACVGERWQLVFPKVELMSEAIIKRDIEPGDLWLVHNDQGFVLIFTDPKLPNEEADERCLRIFEEIREHLLGRRLVARPIFDVDPRILLFAIDEGGMPPLHLAELQPEGAWIPPATELAKRSRYVPPETQARPVAEGFIETGRPATPAKEAGPDWGESAEREAGLGAWGPSADRPEGSGAWSETREKPVATPDWGETKERPEAIGKLVGDWRRADAAETEFGVTRSRAVIDPTFTPVAGESREETQARYVTMGRFNTMFEAIDVEFRSFWAVKQEMVGTFFVDPRLRAGADPRLPAGTESGDAGPPVTGAALIERAEAVGAQAALDMAVLDRALAAVTPRLLAGAKFFFVIPVGYSVLLRKADRHAYFDRWAAAPEAVRQLGRFQCYESTAAIGEAALSEIVIMLAQASRVPIFTSPTDPRHFDRLRDLRIQAVCLDGSGLTDSPAPEALGRACAAGHRLNIVTYLTRVGRAARRAALAAHPAFIEGPRLPAAKALPDRPLTLGVDGFAKPI